MPCGPYLGSIPDDPYPEPNILEGITEVTARSEFGISAKAGTVVRLIRVTAWFSTYSIDATKISRRPPESHTNTRNKTANGEPGTFRSSQTRLITVRFRQVDEISKSNSVPKRLNLTGIFDRLFTEGEGNSSVLA